MQGQGKDGQRQGHRDAGGMAESAASAAQARVSLGESSVESALGDALTIGLFGLRDTSRIFCWTFECGTSLAISSYGMTLILLICAEVRSAGAWGEGSGCACVRRGREGMGRGWVRGWVRGWL